jgi:hypothetical protein
MVDHSKKTLLMKIPRLIIIGCLAMVMFSAWASVGQMNGKDRNGLVDREKILLSLQNGLSEEKAIELFGMPLNSSERNGIKLLIYLYWPIPKAPMPNGQFPKGVHLIFRDNKLIHWEEWYGDGPG